MKILQINSVCGIGSTGRIATDLNQILIEQGHKSYIAFGRNSAINCKSSIRIGTKVDIYFHVAKTRLFDKHGFASKKATIKLVKEIREIKPDIIHLHNIHGYYINMEVLFSFLKAFDKPVVWTLHDCWSFTGHCAYFDYVKCNKWESRCCNCINKKEYPKSIGIDNSLKNFERKKELFTSVQNMTIVVPSVWLEDIVKRSFLKKFPIKVINNGIDLTSFHDVDSDFRFKHHILNKFVILGVSNEWNRRKGLEYFHKIAKQCNQDEVIVLVGLHEKQINRLPKGIIGIEHTNSVKELAEIYSMADVFVNPTLEDNFPTTNLEALACGVPVVTFDTGGSSESVDRKTGIVVEKENMEALIQAIAEIKNRGKVFYSSACIEKSNILYKKENKYLEYIELYKKLDNQKESSV